MLFAFDSGDEYGLKYLVRGFFFSRMFMLTSVGGCGLKVFVSVHVQVVVKGNQLRPVDHLLVQRLSLLTLHSKYTTHSHLAQNTEKICTSPNQGRTLLMSQGQISKVIVKVESKG